jgi:PBP1b-binding outer membrane lipoprotein LpoB
MLNIKRFLAIAGLLLILAACSKKETLADYLPVNPNTTYYYAGLDEYNSFSEFPLYISESQIQYRLETASDAFVQVITVSDGEARVRFFQTDNFGFGEHTGAPIMNYLILKEPIKKGEKWDYERTAVGRRIAEITAVGLEMTVPYGTFTDVIEVTITFASGSGDAVRRYYAKGVGLIREESTRRTTVGDVDENQQLIPGTTVNETVADFHELTMVREGPADAELRLFKPDESGRIIYDTYGVKIETNGANEFIMDFMRKELAASGITLSESTKINSVVTDRSDLVMTVDFDFSESFIADMKNSPAGEEAAFMSVISTLCYFYDHHRAGVRVNGALYYPQGVTVGGDGRVESIYHFNAEPSSGS